MEKCNTGFRLLDYSKPEDAALVLDRLGGEELLKAEYPDLYAAFLRTKQAHAHKRLRNGAAVADGMTAGAYTEDLCFKKATTAAYTDGESGEINGTLSGKTWAAAHGTWTQAVISGMVMDKTDGIFLDTYSTLFSGDYFERMLEHTFVKQKFLEDKEISNHIEFHGVRPDGLMESGESDSTRYLLKGTDAPVLHLAVDHPKSNKGNNPIIILYNRPPDGGESADYDYPNNKALPNNPHAVNTLLPVKVHITFNKALQPLEFDVENSTTPPTLLYKNNGVVRYFTPEKHEDDYEQRLETLAKSFSVSKEDPQVAVMDFGENWNKILDISAYTSENKGTVFLNFGFRIKCKWGNNVVGIPILIRSVEEKEQKGEKYYESWESSRVTVPPIKIKWGCFAQDTLFCMAKGPERRGDSIHPGDWMMSADGKAIQVLEVYRGHEEYLYTLCTEKGKILRMTKGHPVATDSKVRRVEHLRPGDVVLCENGETDIVKFVYEAEYGGEICGFEFVDRPDGELVLANGIQAGDFNLQNRNLSDENFVTPVTQEAQDAASDLERLMKKRLNKVD